MNKSIFMLTAALAATGLNAQTPGDAVSAASPGVIDISLSPSGTKVAYIASLGQSTEAVYVAQLAESGGTPKPILVHPDEASDLRRCQWANEERLVCRLHFSRDAEGQPQDFSRIFAMNAKGQEFAILTADDIPAIAPGQVDRSVLAIGVDGKPDKILMSRNWVPQFVTSTRVSQDAAGQGVEEVDLSDGSRRRVEQPDLAVTGYTADETGRIRFKFGQPPGPGNPQRSYSFRDGQSERWHELAVTDTSGAAANFRPVAVDGAGNRVLGFVDLDGHRAAASVTLESQGKIEVLARRAGADVGDFVMLGKRVVGVADAGEGGATVYFDEDLRKLADGLGKALPGQPSIAFVDASADGNGLLFVSRGDGNSAMAYLFERSTRRLSEVMPVRLPVPAS